MSSKLNAELFSAGLFKELWFHYGLQPTPPGQTEFEKKNLVFFRTVAYAVKIRKQLFKNTLFTKLKYDYKLYSKSGMEFNLYFQSNISYFISYEDIFDEVLMSFTVILQMCVTCYLSSNNIFLDCALPCWIDYFETSLKDRFYADGGWEELDNWALSYQSEMLETHTIHKACTSRDDIFNVRNLLEYANKDYDVYDVLDFFKRRILKGNANSCPSCLPLYYAFTDFCLETEQSCEEVNIIEGYLQIFLKMPCQEEIDESKEQLLDDLKEMGLIKSNETIDMEILDLAGIKSGSSIEEELSSNETYNAFKNHLRTYLTDNLREKLFIEDDNFHPAYEQCMFCGGNYRLPLSNERILEETRIEVIKCVIDETVDNIKETFSGKKQDYYDTVNNIIPDEDKCVNNVLNLFLTLGIEPLTSKMMAHFKTKRNPKKKNRNKLKNSSPNFKQDAKQDPEKK